MAVLSENTQTEKRQRVRDKPGEEEEKLEGKLRERREGKIERRRGGKDVSKVKRRRKKRKEKWICQNKMTGVGERRRGRKQENRRRERGRMELRMRKSCREEVRKGGGWEGEPDKEIKQE